MTSEAKKQHDELMEAMAKKKAEWDAEDAANPDGPDDTDKLLSEAIALAIEQGKGWKDGERQAYLDKILDDDYIPPLFASTEDELERTGLTEAFASLQYDDPPEVMMLSCKKKGNDAFVSGKKNVAKNVQYYRDAVNHYYEASFHADRVNPVEPGYEPEKDEKGQPLEEGPFYTKEELDVVKATLCSNAAMAHTMLKNWGFAREDATKAVGYDPKNVKAWYRLAKAYQMLKKWEEAGDAIESGLAVPGEDKNTDLLKLQKLLEGKIRKARQERQKRERARAERAVKVKGVWKHCDESGIGLGRVPLVASVTDEEDEELGEDDEAQEARWHNHFPHTGLLPERSQIDGEWTWPVMFIYPSHRQSDFVRHFGESEMLALRMAEMFPEPEDTGSTETHMPWDYNNEFKCTNLAIYFEVHCTERKGEPVHPESVERLKTQGEAMRFFESSRALKGDEGEEMANLARLVERKKLHQQRKAWKKAHGSLWAKPDPSSVVRVHPAATLRDVLTDSRMVVPSFLVTFTLFPEDHPAHKEFLKERQCLGIIQPETVG